MIYSNKGIRSKKMLLMTQRFEDCRKTWPKLAHCVKFIEKSVSQYQWIILIDHVQTIDARILN